MYPGIRLSDTLAHLLRQCDEPSPIPRTSGTPEARARMMEKLQSMSVEGLLKAWDELRDFNPRCYYDAEGKIGMTTWAEEVQAALNAKGIFVG